MLLESFSQTLLRLLGIPPGTSLRKRSSNKTSPLSIEDNDYVNSIVSITVDDICIGDTPLSVNFDIDTPSSYKEVLTSINAELNSIVKWVAKDLCIKGVSVYRCLKNKDNNSLVILPSLDDYEFYLSTDKRVVAFNLSDDKKSKVPEKDLLIFINYDLKSFSKVEDDSLKKFAFKITPVAMQLNNASSVVSKITSIENAILRYRAQTSRYARWANVDIGLSQGDAQKEVVDSIASALNADSMDLSMTSESATFDDNIPVIPNRKGLGKPEIQESVANVNISDLADLDYWLGKMNLVMRFPASYMDFSKSLDATAVSLIRGDIRYSKLCNSIRSKICNTINTWVNESTTFSKYHPVFSLTQLPSSEDSDVIEALNDYIQLSASAEDFINVDGSKELKLHRLRLLQDLFSSSTTSPMLQSWFEDYRDYIEQLEDFSNSDTDSESSEIKLPSDLSLKSSELSTDETLNVERSEPPSDIEILERE